MKTLLFSLLFFIHTICHADLALTERSDVKNFISQTHKKFQLPKPYIKKALLNAKLQQRVIHSIKKPKEKAAWTDYRAIFITQSRIKRGVQFLKKHQKILNKAEKKYGVPKEVITAILGIETFYGERQGRFRVLDSLSTLAFGFKNRARFFKKELANFLKLCHEQKISPASVYGSYAGAIGQAQFMPSSYRHYAVDFSGSGKIDLRNNTADAIGSVANFLHIHGWQANQGITEKAITQGQQYKKWVSTSRKAQYSLAKLKQYGINSKQSGDAKKGSLLALNSPKKTEYWLAYPNFFVITRYNTSEQYALAVALLAKKLKALSVAKPIS